jgi:hypothetical protein
MLGVLPFKSKRLGWSLNSDRLCNLIKIGTAAEINISFLIIKFAIINKIYLLSRIKMFNLYEFEKRVRQEADTLNQTLRDEKIHETQRSNLLIIILTIYRKK